MRKFNLIFTLIFICGNIVKDGANGIFWPCETNDDCTAVGSSCTLAKGLCECDSFDSVFSEDFTQCLTTSLFGDTCEATVQCNLMPSGANCKTGVCDCADGQTYVRGKCRPLNGLGHSCKTDLDCYFGYDRQSVSCQDRVCACADGYYQRYGNICRRKSMEIDDACVVDTDCDELGANVKCTGLKCQYVDEIETETTEVAITVTPIPTQQTEYNNAHLQPDGLTNGDGTQNDSSDNENTNTNENVDNSEIETTEHRTTNTRKSREIAVQTSIEAYELKDFETKRNVRHIGTTTTTATTATAATGTETLSPNNGSRRISAATQRSHYHSNRLPSTLFRFVGDDVKTYSTLSNTDDDETDDKKFGSSCTDNGKSCNGLSHSICSNNVCLCRQAYYPRNGKCFAELGEIAESTDACEYEFDDISKTCICQKNYFYERDLRSCRKPIQYHLSCTSNSQCSPFGAAYCDPVIPRRCTCEEYAEYDALQQMCLYKQGLGAECETNEGCPVTNSICSNRYCVCKDNFYEKNSECVAGIGADCAEDIDCLIDNADCQLVLGNNTNLGKESDGNERKCQCRRGYVHFKDECLKQAENFDDECIENEQCQPLLASCIDKQCSCTDEQHNTNGRCEVKKALGETCSKGNECFVEKDPETVECRNSVCKCKFGYQAEGGNQHCIRVVPNKKNSSGRPSALKIITFVLFGSAFLITSAAIKQAYY